MVACRSHGTAPTWGATPATALAVLCPLAVVADDGGCQTLSSLEGNPCSSRLIREGSGVWYRFQLLRLGKRRLRPDSADKIACLRLQEFRGTHQATIAIPM